MNTQARPLIPYKWELLALLWLAFFLNQADRQIFNAVLPLIRDDLNLSDAQLGLIASVLIWTLGVLFPVAGYAGDIFSKKRIITSSVLFWSMATLCTGFGTTAAHLLLFRGLAMGGGEAFYAPSAFTLIARFHRKTRALAMAIHQTSLYVGVTISGLLGGLIGQAWGLEGRFLLLRSRGSLFGGSFPLSFERPAARR